MAAPTTRLTEREATVLRILTDAADNNLPCPNGAALFRLAKCRSPSAPNHILDSLRRKGHIAVERGALWRIVTILETGRSTAKGAMGASRHHQPAPEQPAIVYADPDSVLREGRNLHRGISLAGWRAAHAEAYG